MAGLRVDETRCIGCTRCVRACATGGIEVKDRLARPTDACVFCGACIDACPVDAISIEREEAGADLVAYRDIWVFVQADEHDDVLPVAFELLGRARALAAQRGCAVVALLPQGPGSAGSHERELIARGADRVLTVHDERMVPLDAEVCARWVCDLAQRLKPEIILYGATAFGRELAPMVAVRLETGLTADCTRLEIDGATGLLQQTRPAFGGNLMATIECPARRPQMATVRPGVFAGDACPRSSVSSDAAAKDQVVEYPLDASVRSRVRVLATEPAQQGASIAQAKRLVVVGRGIGSKKQLPLMQRLADALDAELGCTRPLVEAGWLEYPHQVGQTGVSVAPELLISIGVSGAIQHLAGIGGAKTIIAINEDAQAPIFGIAHYKAVGDAIEIVDNLVRELEDASVRS